jgi:RNA polymerase sigma-70 factor (ECF subfamily)
VCSSDLGLSLLAARPARRKTATLAAEISNPEEPGAGDLRLFERFVREHEQEVFTYILRMVGGRDEAADLAQEALLQTYRTWSQVDPESAGGYIKWCYRIAHNLCIDFLRRKRPRAAEDEELERAVDQRALRPEEVYENRVEAGRLREALLDLDEKYRSVLLLRYQTEMSYEQIAAALELPLPTVETRIHRAKKMLREKLKRM